MSTQPQALRLAEHIHALFVSEWGMNSPMAEDSKIVLAELRRLHVVNEELLGALEEYVNADPVDDALNPRKRKARAAIAKAGGEA